MKFSKEFTDWYKGECDAYNSNQCLMVERVYRAFNAHNKELDRLRRFEKKVRKLQDKCNRYGDKSADTNHSLVEQMAKLEEENAELKEHIKADCIDCTDYIKNKRLEKENTELRTKVTALENANRAMVKELDDMTSGGLSVLENVVRNKEQLTKAIEIIKDMLRDIPNRMWYTDCVIKQAEQFLNSEVEK